MNRSRNFAVAALLLALTCYIGLFFVSTALSDAWTIPLAVGVFGFGLVSFLAALKARANGLTIVAALVAFALLPLTYVLAVVLGSP
ncbi:hypothetical protein HMPREF3130_01850 [Corynebacterium sp. HMSC14B06]|uniref:hypothetical protein n=1 Tax=Corynebacterium TaxID=1716 RepID=UPI00034E54CA|nr:MULTISPECIES: hypothetical protein [unclassified Corynebacterium]EPD48598.1 hypothetical protein HMPREF1206_00552 [Corynebacterium sp. HFH0082]MBC6821873.1 hypothetical protein [Corynebacterium sp. LK33]OFK32133.1 hypothetical protein HMPREF2820_08485 [Corynebacterium sp. HMSC064E08]OFL70664.1 hypothetical protein HMPREF2751_07055 [Corynebacterium sp. HMSC063G05]OFM49900.1 hypothetical protein HMPREF2681_07190 [Corynebacterium sp. HMSC064H12]OFQ03632.1 hypothetical protein HMPREF2960_00695